MKMAGESFEARRAALSDEERLHAELTRAGYLVKSVHGIGFFDIEGSRRTRLRVELYLPDRVES
jgi:hypothetical protein